MTRLTVVAAAAASMLQISPMSGADELAGITVEAQRRAALEHQVHTFVSAIALRPWNESLARWNVPICPLVAGLPRPQGEFILQRLSLLATGIGAPLANERCAATLYIVATRDADALLRAWRKRDARLFGEAPEPQIKRFMTTSRPVRIWYNASVDAASGVPMSGNGDVILGFGMGGTGAGNQPLAGIPTNNHAKLSRLQWDELRSVSSAIVIVDMSRMAGINFGQLADYIAMIGLTEINLDADLGTAPSILGLFTAGAAAPAGLTDWDQAFLKATYHTDQSDKMQLSSIETHVVNELLH